MPTYTFSPQALGGSHTTGIQMLQNHPKYRHANTSLYDIPKEWEEVQSSWFSKSSGAFVVRNQQRSALLRLTASPTSLQLCDAFGRPVAVAKGDDARAEVRIEAGQMLASNKGGYNDAVRIMGI